jgi:hypothetical protein
VTVQHQQDTPLVTSQQQQDKSSLFSRIGAELADLGLWRSVKHLYSHIRDAGCCSVSCTVCMRGLWCHRGPVLLSIAFTGVGGGTDVVKPILRVS